MTAMRPVSVWAQRLWLLWLLLPAAASGSAWHDWDLDPAQLLVASGAWVIALRVLVPGRAFYLLSFPAAWAGAAVLGADALRQVDLLELAAQWHSFDALDLASALRPHRLQLLLMTVLLAGWAALCLRGPAPAGPPRWLPRLAGLGLAGAILAVWLPGVAWTRAWPASAAVIAASAAAGQPAWAGLAVAGAGPLGRPDDDWGAQRTPPTAPGTPDRATVVLVIGESLRADFLRECGGPAGVRPLAPGTLVACDVSAGSNATHTSVPLLISRDLPGLRSRIPADATFQRALARVGFETAWLATQGADVAWPDARVQHFGEGRDAEVLLPALDTLLAAGHERLSIVLHTTGSHEPYCARFDRRHAPFGDHCDALGERPTAENRALWRAMYANAVDASIGFVDAVIARLERQPGPVFLVFTPDHGENLIDDERMLYGHALRRPTVWDTRVPAVFWANEAWKAAHPQRWAQLQRNIQAPLMHADLVPTLLKAMQVEVADRREQAQGLLDRELPPRQRQVQVSIGRAVAVEALEAPADASGPTRTATRGAGP